MVVAGCTIHTETSLEENQEYTAIISQTAEALLQAKCKGIAGAKLLNIFEAEELMAKAGREQSQTDKDALEKHMLIKAYKVKDASIVTSEWVRTYNSPREIKVFKNLSEFKANPALDIIAHTDKKGLEMDQDDENVIDVIHKLSDPLSFKLKYAKDILGACGFDSPFDDKSITAAEIKRDIDLYWSRLVEGRNMKDICIQLKIRCPTYRVWDFKNKKNFMNSVLNEVWGIHVTGVNRKALSYHIKYQTEVGKNKDDFFTE
ncbi:hypothetical protein EC957_009862 [Mortierella hygrophila]|uniref:Uncharacterized protein n=1 Tax=Mortierella hygrophila TaxID=979708 RepID=A0A9P6EV77_9FUNG|nr:hypothetical protein EC957_009862 [Mortierella hygrophila]